MLWPRGMEIKVNSFKFNFGCFRQDLKKNNLRLYEHISMYYKQRLLEFISSVFYSRCGSRKFSKGFGGLRLRLNCMKYL